MLYEILLAHAMQQKAKKTFTSTFLGYFVETSDYLWDELKNTHPVISHGRTLAIEIIGIRYLVEKDPYYYKDRVNLMSSSFTYIDDEYNIIHGKK